MRMQDFSGWTAIRKSAVSMRLKEQMEKAYPGFRYLDAEVKYNGINAAFYIYARMVRN